MVFSAGVLQGHSSIHSRHTFCNLPCLLQARKRRQQFSAQASGEQAPALASKPSLAGPPKRPPPPAPSTPAPVVQEQQQKGSHNGSQSASKQRGLDSNGQSGPNGSARSASNVPVDRSNQRDSSRNRQHSDSNRPENNRHGRKGQMHPSNKSKQHQSGNIDLTRKSTQGNEAPQEPVTTAVAQATPAPVQSQQAKATVQQQPATPSAESTQAAAQQSKPSLPAMAGPPARRPAVKPPPSPPNQHLPQLRRDHLRPSPSHDAPVQLQQQPPEGQASDSNVLPHDIASSAASTSQTVDMPAKPSPPQASTSATSTYEHFAAADFSGAAATALSSAASQLASADTASQADESSSTAASDAASSTPQQPASQPAAPSLPQASTASPAAPASAPSPPRPSIAGPPKRPPPRPAQRYRDLTQRNELPGGVFNRSSRDTSWDSDASMSGPSESPGSMSPLPPPSPQAAQPGPLRPPSPPPQPGTTAAAAQQVAAQQPALAAKPGLRAPPSRAPAMPSIDAARFDIRDFRDSQDARSGQQPQTASRPRSPQQNGNTPSVDPALATVNGVPAPAKGPAKKLRGKKRGEEEEEGKGKGKSKGRGDERGSKQVTRVDAGSRRQSRAQRKQQRNEAREADRPEKEDILEVGLEGMSVQDLADKLAIAPTEILRELFMKGIMAQVNQVLDFETVQIIGEAFEVDILEKDVARIDDMARKTVDYLDEDDIDVLQPRPPVVVVMGHVDHGKTSLLDTIRKSTVAAGEAGGITQAIGAYTVGVDMEGEKKNVTFLDTPGHEAFSAMRARGARVTDIAIIVVAADDGVRPQTLEAISHANAAEVPIVVAINKVDKEGANPERVKQELSEAGLLPEEWGGKTPMIQISAKKGTGVDDLLETVALVAEVEQLMANPEKPAAGTVLEAHLDKRVGAIATLLVQTGTLHIGDVVVAGSAYGKVRSMKDNFGDKTAATPSTAVQMSGLNMVPVAGDDFVVAKSLDEGRKVAEVAGAAQRVGRLADQAGGGSMITTKSLASYDDDGEEEVLHRLNLILKTDASGSLEAVRSALGALPQDSVVLRYLMATPNDITVSDIDLAAASKGLVLGFNVEPSETVLAAAKQQGVTVRSYKVIYDLLDDMRAAMEGKLSALEQRVPIGEAEVRAVFGKGSKLVAGCMVTEGVLRSECFVVVKRGRKQVWEGELTSLRRVKESVSEVSQGNECGVGCKSFIDWAEGDKIEAFELVSKRRTLEDAPPPPQFVAAPAQ